MSRFDRILTIDLGTSGPKVSLFDFDLNLIGSVFKEVPLVFVGSQGVEQDPRAWTAAIESAVDELSKEYRSDLSRVRALNVTAQWSGTVPISKDGAPLMNGMIWMDSRGAPHANKVTDGLIKVDGYGLFSILKWIRLTGGGPTKSGKDSISHILYLKNEEKEIYSNTRVFLEPKDYLNFYLCGRAVASFDSIVLHWVTDNRDIHNICYSEALIKKAGLDREKLPELVPTNSILGKVLPEISRKFGIPESAEVISGTPDLHSAAVGSGGVLDYSPHLYIGTSSWIISHVPTKKTDLFHNMASIPSGVPGRYMLINEQQTAGASLQFLKNQILFPQKGISPHSAPDAVYSKMDELAASVPVGSDGLFYFPWLNGERSPFDVKHLRGGFVNLSLRHEQRHLIRAVMEGVALNLKWLLGYTEKFCGRKTESIRFIGGGAQSRVWAQILADVFQIPVDRMKDPLTANSKGVAALALMALGVLAPSDIAKRILIEERFEPNPLHRKTYERSFQFFLDYFKRNLSWFKRLNQEGSE